MSADPTRHDDGLAAAATDKVRIVRCPHCGGDSVFAPSNPARPFCSERCKNMDFGAWASESFRVAAPITSEDLDLDNPTLQ
jgi:endogenous inhibitor of DNA gyrase (YacG/DUF329 family)